MAGYETTVHTVVAGCMPCASSPTSGHCCVQTWTATCAVEEMLRWTTVGINWRRIATRQTALGGQVIETGDKVVVFLLSANRDETVFTDPCRFHIDRDPNPHIAFGGGSHYCLGARLPASSFGSCSTNSYGGSPTAKSRRRIHDHHPSPTA